MGWSLLGLAWNLGLASWVWFWIRIWKCFTSAINYHLEAHCASPASRFQSWPAWLFTSLIMITLGLSLLIARIAVKWVFIREHQLPMDVFYGFQFEFILSIKYHFAMTSNEAWWVPCFTNSDPRKQSQVYKDALVTVSVFANKQTKEQQEQSPRLLLEPLPNVFFLAVFCEQTNQGTARAESQTLRGWHTQDLGKEHPCVKPCKQVPGCLVSSKHCTLVRPGFTPLSL